MMELLSTIENSAFCSWVREGNSIFAYYGFLFLHTIGLATVVGISSMIDLRLLGFVPTLPIAPLQRYFPIVWLGIAISVVSGTVLLAADATNRLSNPLFGLKMAMVALAIANTILIRRTVFRQLDPEGRVPAMGRVLAAASCFLWLAVITAGRLMAYLGAESGAK